MNLRIAFLAAVALLAVTAGRNDVAANPATVHQVPGEFASIQEAIDAASPGDEVLVSPGEYAENISFGGKALTLRSSDGAGATHIVGASLARPVVTMDFASGSVLGFTIRGGRDTFGGGIAILGAAPTIRGNVFEGNYADFSPGIWGNSASAHVEGNVFRNNRCSTQFNHAAGVVTFVNGSNARVENNIFVDNACNAINVTVPQPYAPVIVNNTIVRNEVGIHVDIRIPAARHTYRNNIIAENLVGVEAVFGLEENAPPIDHNLLFANGVDYVGIADRTGIDGNISADPGFRDSADADFRLTFGSPAIDSGNALLAPLLDKAGDTRPSDGDLDGATGFEIGAFEHYVCMDQDGDAAVTGEDVAIVTRARFSPDPPASADVNRDGRIDHIDVAFVIDALGRRC